MTGNPVLPTPRRPVRPVSTMTDSQLTQIQSLKNIHKKRRRARPILNTDAGHGKQGVVRVPGFVFVLQGNDMFLVCATVSAGNTFKCTAYSV